MKMTENLVRVFSGMSRGARRVLNISLPLITAALCYILYYTLSDPLNYSEALKMTERAMGALLLALTVAFVLDMNGKRDR